MRPVLQSSPPKTTSETASEPSPHIKGAFPQLKASVICQQHGSFRCFRRSFLSPIEHSDVRRVAPSQRSSPTLRTFFLSPRTRSQICVPPPMACCHVRFSIRPITGLLPRQELDTSPNARSWTSARSYASARFQTPQRTGSIATTRFPHFPHFLTHLSCASDVCCHPRVVFSRLWTTDTEIHLQVRSRTPSEDHFAAPRHCRALSNTKKNVNEAPHNAWADPGAASHQAEGRHAVTRPPTAREERHGAVLVTQHHPQGQEEDTPEGLVQLPRLQMRLGMPLAQGHHQAFSPAFPSWSQKPGRLPLHRSDHAIKHVRDQPDHLRKHVKYHHIRVAIDTWQRKSKPIHALKRCNKLSNSIKRHSQRRSSSAGTIASVLCQKAISHVFHNFLRFYAYERIPRIFHLPNERQIHPETA